MEKETKTNNPLMCDPVEGFCGLPGTSDHNHMNIPEVRKAVKIIYFTDPICSSCWGIEPQLRRLKLEYGQDVEVEYRMGGLLPDWSYNSGGISKPSDVAHHWDEVSVYYDMPIDGDVWLNDPLESSYPPSIAFKAAQLQDKEKAVIFMRTLREMVFLKKKNIAKWDNIADAASQSDLNVSQLKSDYSTKAQSMFEEDLKFAKELGVRGFPTMFIVKQTGSREIVYGSKPYAAYESAILKVYPEAKKSAYGQSWEKLFAKYASLTAKEFSLLSELSRSESEHLLNLLTDQGHLDKLLTKNGAIWYLKEGR